MSYTRSGWTYEWDIEREPDCIRILHYAVKGDEKRLIPHSCFQDMTDRAFTFHVDNNFRLFEDRMSWDVKRIDEQLIEWGKQYLSRWDYEPNQKKEV